MDEYNFEGFKAAITLLSEALQHANNHEELAFYLSKKTDNQFYDFIFMNYIGEIENRITEALGDVMSAFDPPIGEDE